MQAGLLGDRRVRCLNADRGCDFVGQLKHLDEHLRESCALYSTVCLKCGDTVAHKDMRFHYPACGGRPGVFLRSADARCLLDNLSAACEKLQQAVASADRTRAALSGTRSIWCANSSPGFKASWLRALRGT
ncbi:hypothetical protein HPB52_008229 [Rhipicephalus sanguineus]|uniref:Uncharacterized protein n=1 Tax=Rhipicephalus sanguineus TaxID=34632 RepID=A0A9D4QCS6_RHISA|nr:hypothetical protein HPB52_008229 [Rhipicephalus sanguineus]